jgi:hypothetical protein
VGGALSDGSLDAGQAYSGCVTRWTLVLLLLAALCAGAQAAPAPRASAFALLRDGTLMRLSLPAAAPLARRRVGPAAPSNAEAGRFLARSAGTVYALDPASPVLLAALDARTLKIRWQRPLDRGTRYRGLILAGKRLYAYGYRPGGVVDPDSGSRENAAVLTALDLDGAPSGSWTIRPAERHSWWEWWGAASTGGRMLALSWHGGCGARSGSLCTTGTDLVDVGGTAPRPCVQDRRQNGCIHVVHGAIEPYRSGWVATTGGEPLLVLDAGGRVTRTLRSGLRKEHLMSFALDARRGRLFVLGSCFGGREGLRVVSLATGRSRRVVRGICGSELVLGPSGTLLAVEADDFRPAPNLVVIARSSGHVLRRRSLPAPILALLQGV